MKWLLITVTAAFSALASAQTTPLLQPHVSFVNGSGNPCAGCKLFSYQAGTNTPLQTYTSSSGSTTNTTPVILDATGSAQIWLGSAAYKFALLDTNGTTIWTVDNVPVVCRASGCAFSGPITFVGGVTGSAAETTLANLGGFTTVLTTPQTVPGPVTFAQLSTGPAGTLLGTFVTGSQPLQQSIDAAGNIWVASAPLSEVRELSPTGATLNTFSMATPPDCAVVDGAGDIWLCNQAAKSGYPHQPDGLCHWFLCHWRGEPDSIAFDQQGRAWISNSGTTSVTELAPNGTSIGTYATGGTNPFNVIIDSAGNAWTDNFASGTVSKISPAGTLLGVFTVGTQPQVMAFDQAGGLWVPNQGSNSLMKLSADGTVQLIIALTTVTAPGGCAVDGNGNVWVYGGNKLAEYSNSGLLLGTFTVGTESAYASIDQQGNLWITNFGSNNIMKFATGSPGVLTPSVLALGQQHALLNESVTTFGSLTATTFGQDIGVQNGAPSVGLWENGSAGSIGGFFAMEDMLQGFGPDGSVFWSYIGPLQLAVGNPTPTTVLSCTSAGCAVPSNGIQFPAWSQTLPTVGCGTGTPTTIGAVVRVSLMGKTVSTNIVVTDTTNGSCAGFLTVPMPFTAKTNNSFGCYLFTGSVANSAIGYMVLGGTTLNLFNATGGYPAGTGYTVNCNGTVETQ